MNVIFFILKSQFGELRVETNDMSMFFKNKGDQYQFGNGETWTLVDTFTRKVEGFDEQAV